MTSTNIPHRGIEKEFSDIGGWRTIYSPGSKVLYHILALGIRVNRSISSTRLARARRRGRSVRLKGWRVGGLCRGRLD